jgi:lipid II:glycine glycyltransferase (peptidoglycan interpeptide bridge formation enzyme)
MQDLRRFHNLFLETAARNEFFAEPYSFFLNLGASLFPAGMADLFFAQWNGEMLAALLIITFGRRATYLYGGSSAQHRQVMPTYALHWAAICASRERGCTEYDMYGFDPFDQPYHPYSGFSRFKRQFGGRRFDAIGAYDLIFYERVADAIVEKIR